MEPIEAQRRSRSNGLCECLLTALALYGLAPGNASAGDQPQSPDARHNADTQKPCARKLPRRRSPRRLLSPRRARRRRYFRRRNFGREKRGPLEAADAGSEGSVIDAPMLRDTSIARELSEAKTQDRVRLLTLWQSRASSLSLQAGKRGAPSLQWSTPWMHRDSCFARSYLTGCLLVAPRSFGSTVRGGASRQAGAMAPAKPLDLGTPINNQ